MLKKSQRSLMSIIRSSAQRRFSATNVLGERKQDLVCHIWTLLAPHHPCMANVIRVIRPIGDMSVKDQCGFFNI
jgi:hypothetical protein